MELEKEALGFWENLIKMKNKYGFWTLIKIVVFVGFSIAFLIMTKNFADNFTFERQKEVITEAIVENQENISAYHSEQMSRRIDIRPHVQDLLSSTLSVMNADRAFVLELHNGNNNTSGLPFVHFSMTYEQVQRGIDSIDEDYQNITLSRFTFPNYLTSHEIWFGTIDEFEKIDQKAAARLRHNDVSYVVLATIESEEHQIGYYGFTYCNGKTPKTQREIIEFVLQKVQKLSRWLDNNVTEI